jgi:hypothetical protein
MASVCLLSHESGDAMLAAGLAGFTQIAEHTRRTVHATASRV